MKKLNFSKHIESTVQPAEPKKIRKNVLPRKQQVPNIDSVTWQCLTFITEKEETVKNPVNLFPQKRRSVFLRQERFIPKLTKEGI